MMNREIKVSVIIPVYQVENYLERAVDSVLAQTLLEKEIILVDDGSTDSSPEICDSYAQRYPERIRVLHQENQGLGMARNAGARAAVGEYIAFVDSDDTVAPQMYERLYEKAVEGDFDIVMCDVQIFYVETGRTSTVATYPKEEIDLPDYIANGNNITFSVNKLFRRRIWQENQYEKMLFEDISLIPALLTHYPHIGYVPEPFYHYYRRPNTISTTFTGGMTDIIQAYRNFLDTSAPAYREEAVYCAAKQLYWNMTESRVLFQADFISLLQEYKKDFLLNPYIAKDGKVRRILDYLSKEVIPDNIICVRFDGEIPAAYRESIQTDFPRANLIAAGRDYYSPQQLPEPIRRAMEEGQTAYAEEYYSLRILYEQGGIVVNPDRRACLNLKRLRLNRLFFGFEDEQELTTGCYGALKQHYVVQALLESYEADNIFNTAFLPLKERLRDFLILYFDLKVNGRNQTLKNEISVYLPSILAYDMKDGDNCCKRADVALPDGYEMVSGKVLKMWSDRLLENWNLYKQERARKQPAAAKAAPAPRAEPAGPASLEMERRIQEVVDTYENSTCWRLTRPLRALGRLFGR